MKNASGLQGNIGTKRLLGVLCDTLNLTIKLPPAGVTGLPHCAAVVVPGLSENTTTILTIHYNIVLNKTTAIWVI